MKKTIKGKLAVCHEVQRFHCCHLIKKFSQPTPPPVLVVSWISVCRIMRRWRSTYRRISHTLRGRGRSSLCLTQMDYRHPFQLFTGALYSFHEEITKDKRMRNEKQKGMWRKGKREFFSQNIQAFKVQTSTVFIRKYTVQILPDFYRRHVQIISGLDGFSIQENLTALIPGA